MYFLRQLKRFGLKRDIITGFYCCTIESIYALFQSVCGSVPCQHSKDVGWTGWSRRLRGSSAAGCFLWSRYTGITASPALGRFSPTFDTQLIIRLRPCHVFAPSEPRRLVLKTARTPPPRCDNSQQLTTWTVLVFAYSFFFWLSFQFCLTCNFTIIIIIIIFISLLLIIIFTVRHQNAFHWRLSNWLNKHYFISSLKNVLTSRNPCFFRIRCSIHACSSLFGSSGNRTAAPPPPPPWIQHDH